MIHDRGEKHHSRFEDWRRLFDLKGKNCYKIINNSTCLYYLILEIGTMHPPIMKVMNFLIALTLITVVIPFSMSEGSFPPHYAEWGTRETLIVSASGGGDYARIQWAVDNASEGDTVYVEAGTYNENVVINKTISLVGAGRENTTINAGGTGSAVYIGEDYVNISGFKTINSSNWGSAGIYVYNSNYSTIQNNNCSDNDYGIYLYKVGNSTIANNVCSNNSCGIYLLNVENITVNDNICSDNGRGIFLNGQWDGTCNDNNLKRNTCSRNYWYGIRLSYSDNNELDKNTCDSNGEEGIYLMSSDNNQIFDSRCNFNDDSGILLRSSHGNTIENNNCSNNQEGIDIHDSNINTIANNTCHNNYWTDIHLSWTSHSTLFNNEMVGSGIYISGNFIENWNTHSIDNSNTVNGRPLAYWKNVTGMRMPNAVGQVILVNCSAVIVENQNLSNLTKGIILIDSSSNIISYNNFNSNNNYGIYLKNSNNNIISNNICKYNRENGIYLKGSNDNEIFNNTFISNIDEGVYLGSNSHYNSIHHNLLLGNGDTIGPEAKDYGRGNRWNTTTQGNCWAHWSQPDVDDDGIVDKPYGIGGDAYSKDYYPLVNHPDSPLLIADAGPDIIINQNQTANFNGTGSMSPSNVTYYLWSFTYENDNIHLYGPSPNYTFHFPGKYLVTLEVTDQLGLFAIDSLFVTVLDITPPVANAGNDMTIYQYQTIYLQGDESYDNIGITNFSWSFSYDFSNITLYGEIVNFTFDWPGLYRITLKVSDDMGNHGIDIVNITVIDQTPPDADAGDDIVLKGNGTVYFDGSGSRDNVGIINWTWIFDYNGRNITLYGLKPMFLFNESGKYIIHLYVIDEFGNEGIDWISINVNEIEVEPQEDDDDGDLRTPEDENKEGSEFPLYFLIAILLGAFIVISLAFVAYKYFGGDTIGQMEEDEEERVEIKMEGIEELSLKERGEILADGKSEDSNKIDEK